MSHDRFDLDRRDILIVDDTPDNVRILSTMLTKQGYKVRKALTGQMALTVCNTVLPDLILLDVMMPGMDGYEVCKRLKASEKTREIPVLFISALDSVIDKVKAFGVGGADYITKPFQIEEVLARVDRQLTIQHLYRQLQERNAQLQKMNEELQRSNTELEQFACVASHDLQSPLQAIVGNADMLTWKYERSLDTDAQRYINQIVEAGMRMKQLIEDLLGSSRIGTSAPEFQLIDCTTVLDDALANLRGAIASSGATITHSQLPTVMGNDTQLTRLFQNLISNAIKFRRPQVPPQINISAAAQNNSQWLIGVHDNGIGIASQDYKRIFEIFQRLHTSGEYPGTGIGMTICKKIVERHGGRIWVESQLGVGTSFYFTLPSIIIGNG